MIQIDNLIVIISLTTNLSSFNGIEPRLVHVQVVASFQYQRKNLGSTALN
jgi:hypothetical protein